MKVAFLRLVCLSEHYDLRKSDLKNGAIKKGITPSRKVRNRSLSRFERNSLQNPFDTKIEPNMSTQTAQQPITKLQEKLTNEKAQNRIKSRIPLSKSQLKKHLGSEASKSDSKSLEISNSNSVSRPKSKNQLQLRVRINPETEVINKDQNQDSGPISEENQVQNKPPSAWRNPRPTPMPVQTKSKSRIRHGLLYYRTGNPYIWKVGISAICPNFKASKLYQYVF